jgi:hypothetical protein
VSAQCGGIRFSPQPLCTTALAKKPFGGWPGWKLYSIIHRLLDNICDAQRYRAQFGRLANGRVKNKRQKVFAAAARCLLRRRFILNDAPRSPRRHAIFLNI